MLASVLLTLLGIRVRGPAPIQEEVEIRAYVDAEDTDSEDLERQAWARVRYAHLRTQVLEALEALEARAVGPREPHGPP